MKRSRMHATMTSVDGAVRRERSRVASSFWWGFMLVEGVLEERKEEERRFMGMSALFGPCRPRPVSLVCQVAGRVPAVCFEENVDNLHRESAQE